jgi:hypothetical protein
LFAKFFPHMTSPDSATKCSAGRGAQICLV